MKYKKEWTTLKVKNLVIKNDNNNNKKTATAAVAATATEEGEKKRDYEKAFVRNACYMIGCDEWNRRTDWSVTI